MVPHHLRVSTGSPATNVTWLRDGQPLTLNGSTYELTQTVVNRKLSTYKNVLTINRATSNIIGNTYNCTVINALGKVSRTLIACKCMVHVNVGVWVCHRPITYI